MVSKTVLMAAAAAASVLAAVPAAASMKISLDPTRHVSCSAGACVATAKSAVLNVGELQNMLAASDVTLNAGAGADTIEIDAPLAWSSASRLTLNAQFNLNVKAPIAVEGTGGLTIVTNANLQGGDLRIFPGAKIDFWDDASSLVINGQSYKLAHDLASLAAAIAIDRFGAFAFAADYDAGPDGVYDSPPIPNFQGTFEGLGHTIDHLDVNSQSNPASLFGSTISAVLRDVNLANVYVRSDDDAGALAHDTLNVVVINVTSSGSVHGGAYFAGGLIGYAAGSYGRVTQSSSSATVTGGPGVYVGGLVGQSSSPISLSRATGKVFGRGENGAAGGLVGFALAPISQSFATGNVTTRGQTTVGGLVGYAQSAVTDSYAMGTVEAGGGSDLGGLIGGASADLHSSYSTSPVVYRTAARRAAHIGGFLGRYDGGSNIHDYWDIDTSGQNKACQTRCGNVQGLADQILKTRRPAGFDPAIWGQDGEINHSYPYLLANPPE